jgi:molecular chaperone HscB
MQAAMSAERACWKCRSESGAALVCPRCAAVQPLPPGADLFAVLALPRRLALDGADLETRYLEASRAVHPDRHQTATPRERELSLVASAAVNRAYRTLRDPVARGRYWLELHGRRLAEGGPEVPPAIAADVFETQEKLEELRAAAGESERAALRRDVESLREGFEARLATLRDGLTALYAEGPGEPSLDDLRNRLAEVAYLGTLLGDIDQTIGEGFRGTDRRH